MNATGEGDLKDYYDMVSSIQEHTIRPKLNIIDEIINRSTIGDHPADWDFSFNPLWQISETERSTIELQNSQRDRNYYDMGTLTPDIIAKQLRTDEVYQYIDEDYISNLEEIVREEEENEENSFDNGNGNVNNFNEEKDNEDNNFNEEKDNEDNSI